MTRARVRIALVALAAALCAAPLGAAGQNVEITLSDFHNPAVRILQDYTLRPGDSVEHVVVIGGTARIEGHVDEDVVVILGKTELASTAVIEGTVVTVAGTAEVTEGAKVGRDFVAIGEARTPASFSPGGQHVVIGLAGFGDGMRSIVPWLTHGLLLGRPIVPWLGWVWMAAAIFFFLNLCVNVLFDGPVRASTTTLQGSPLSAFMAGLLVLLLLGPVCLLLMVSVIGVIVVPFVMCALVAAAIIGRVGFARWIGSTMVPQEDPADRAASTRSFVIGSAVMCVAYMIPIIGFMVWALAGVFGLGAATLAFHKAYRRENPKPPKKSAPPSPPSPPAIPPSDSSGLQAGDPGLQAGDPDRVQPAAAAAVELPPDLSAVASAEAEGGSYLPSGGSSVAQGGNVPPSQPWGTPLAFPRAEFVERLAGLAIDAIAIGIIAQLLSLDHHGDPGERLMVFLALVYHVGFWTWKGTTPGGMICQLRVIRTDGKALDFPESLVRGLTGIISLAVVGLGFLWILRDPERQGWHDRVAGTYVVKVPRAYSV